MSAKYLAIGYPDNPQLQESRCRICYLTHKPLVTICQCSGSIEYVHEECVIEWITKQIQKSQVLEIPKCQICKQQYNAQLKIGKRKVCYDIFVGKIQQLPKRQLLNGIVYIIGFVVALWVLINAFMTQLFYLIQTVSPQLQMEIEEMGIRFIFTDMVFPIIFMNSCLQFFKKIKYICLTNFDPQNYSESMRRQQLVT